MHDVGLHPARIFAGRPCLMAAVFVSSLFSQFSLNGQSAERITIKDSREIQASEFGFKIPDGAVVDYPGKNVTTTDEEGRGCVARVHLKIGDSFIVMLPDGQLVGRTADNADPTDREFVPSTHDEIGKSLAQGPLNGFRILNTERFLFIYNTTPDFAKVTSTVMETMLTGVMAHCEAQGLQVHEPELPLPVIMFHRQPQFQMYSQKPPGVSAYYEILTNRVVLHEDSMFSGVDENLARQDLLSTIAHEGAHQILHNIGVQQRLSRWPLWIGEGIAEYLAPTKPGLKFAWKGAGKINDLRMWELEGFLQKQFIKGFNGDTVDQTVNAGFLDSTGYSAAWSITHFLAEQRKADFDRYMRYLSRMPPMQGMLPKKEDLERSEIPTVPGNMVHFKKFFGEDLNAFENQMVKHMAKQDFESPFGGLPHYVCTVEIPGLEGSVKHACFYLDSNSVRDWQAAVVESMSAYDREHARFELSAYKDRADANRYIKKWKREKQP